MTRTSCRMTAGTILLILSIIGFDRCASHPAPPPRNDPAPPGEGQSCETAIRIEARNEDEGIRAEKQWLREHYPGSRIVRQALGACDDFPMDEIEFQARDGETRKVIFNIQSFFGKW